MDFRGDSAGTESTCNVGDLCSVPGSGRSPGEENGNPLQYSCLENPLGQRSLAGYSPWGRRESDTTEQPSIAAVCACQSQSPSLQVCPLHLHLYFCVADKFIYWQPIFISRQLVPFSWLRILALSCCDLGTSQLFPVTVNPLEDACLITADQRTWPRVVLKQMSMYVFPLIP